MPDHDGVVTDQDLLDNEADNPLPLVDIKFFGRGAQSGQESGKRLREA